MNENLTRDDLELILESLSFGKERVTSYPHYPDEQFKRQQITRIERLMEKIRAMRRETKGSYLGKRHALAWRMIVSRRRRSGPLSLPVPRPVRFGPPRDVKLTDPSPRAGEIIDEVWVDLELNNTPPRQPTPGDWGDYSFCSQLIEWAGGERQIRLAYYRRRAGEDHWEFASQTTVCSTPATIKALLEKTLAKQWWFESPSVAKRKRE
jgi:hypothetical protein